MATTATLNDGFEYEVYDKSSSLTDGYEYKDEPKSATLVKGWIYGYADFLLSGFEYVNKRPKVFTYLIPDD